MTVAKQTSAPWPVVKADQVDFDDATPVISTVQKFVFPVPAFPGGGEPLVYPDEHDLAGTPVLAYDASPIGDRGVVFWNATDACWQAAAGDGRHVVIVNEVSEPQAEQLHRHFAALGKIESITLEEFKQFLDYCASIGLVDVYQSDVDYVKAHLTPVMRDSLQLEHDGLTLGFVKREDRDIAFACHTDRPFEFINTSGVRQNMQHGGVIVRLDDDIHAVQPDIFRATYRLADEGKAIGDLARDIATLMLNDKTTQRQGNRD